MEDERLKEDINTRTVYNYKAQKLKNTEVIEYNEVQLLDNGVITKMEYEVLKNKIIES